MTEQQQPPEFITPRALYDMSSDAIDKLLDGIRTRRLQAARHHEAAVVAAKEAADEKARAALLKQCELLSNEFIRIDKAMTKMDDRVNKMRALRLELGLD